MLHVSPRSIKPKSIETPSNWEKNTADIGEMTVNDYEMASEEELLALDSMVEGKISSSIIENHVVLYMASLLKRSILEGRWYKRITCEEYFKVFGEDETTDDDFVNTKMKSQNLRAPARSTVGICAVAEKLMRACSYEPGHFSQIQNGVHLNLNPETLFSLSDFETHSESNHKIILVSLIIEMYVEKKLD